MNRWRNWEQRTVNCLKKHGWLLPNFTFLTDEMNQKQRKFTHSHRGTLQKTTPIYLGSFESVQKKVITKLLPAFKTFHWSKADLPGYR
jgi:hypothetical protein